MADDAKSKSQLYLTRDGHVSPVILGVPDAGDLVIMPVSMETEEDMAGLKEFMAKVSLEFEALIFVFESLCLDSKECPEGSLKDNPDASEALIVVIYTKDQGIHLRQVLFSKKDTGGYSFFDLGWHESKEGLGNFKNPYTNT
jgi:hypothetical protein